jgi:hypothetical protein
MTVRVSSGTVSVSITLNHAQNLCVKMFDIAGRMVASRGFSNMTAGNHSIRLNPKFCLPGGIYVIRTQFDGATHSKTCVVIR